MRDVHDGDAVDHILYHDNIMSTKKPFNDITELLMGGSIFRVNLKHMSKLSPEFGWLNWTWAL